MNLNVNDTDVQEYTWRGEIRLYLPFFERRFRRSIHHPTYGSLRHFLVSSLLSVRFRRSLSQFARIQHRFIIGPSIHRTMRSRQFPEQHFLFSIASTNKKIPQPVYSKNYTKVSWMMNRFNQPITRKHSKKSCLWTNMQEFETTVQFHDEKVSVLEKKAFHKAGN